MQDAGLYELKEIYKDEVDLWLHTGDSQLDPHDPALLNFKVVEGNTDWPGSFPTILEVKFDFLNLLITHGDQYHVGRGLEELYELSLNKKINIVLYGHTHIPKVDKINDIYFINPGSLHFPRGSYPMGTYALLRTDKNKVWISYYNSKHEHITDWNQELVFNQEVFKEDD